MTDLLTIPATPTTGAYFINDEIQPQNNTATQQRENVVTVATNDFDGQYESFYDGWLAIKDTGGTIQLKGGTYYWDLPSEEINPLDFDYTFEASGPEQVTIKVLTNTATAIYGIYNTSDFLGSITIRNIKFEWDNSSTNTITSFVNVRGKEELNQKRDVFVNCEFTIKNNIYGRAIFTSRRHLFVDGCTFNDCDYGIFSGQFGGDTISKPIKNIINCSFYGGATSFGQTYIEGFTVNIENCLFDSYITRGIFSNVSSLYDWSAYIRNNKFTNRGTPVFNYREMQIKATTVVIDGNFIQYDIAPATLLPTDIMLISNTLSTGSCIITNNRIEATQNVTDTSAAATLIHGISVNPNGSSCLIEGNHIDMDMNRPVAASGTLRGIYSTGTRVRATGNHINTTGANYTTREGINFAGDWNTASLNRIINHTTAVQSTGANDIVVNNVLV